MTQGGRMAASLADAGGEAPTLEMPGLTHFTASLAAGDSDGPWVPAATAFIRRHATA